MRRYKTIEIIGAPVSLASPEKGASMGPDAIRIAGLRESLVRLERNFIDTGNMRSLEEPFPPKEFPKGEIRYLDEVYDFLDELKSRVLSALEKGNMPLVLGGDHSIGIASMAAVAQHYTNTDHKPGIIWFDAHTDFNTEETSPSGNIHGMPLAVATGMGNKKLLSLFEGSRPFNPNRVVIIGVRSVDPTEGAMLKDLGVKVFTMKDIDEYGMLHCVRSAIRIASPNKDPIHLSFDIDGIDHAFAPGTGTPVWGGVTLREAHHFMEILDESGLVGSIDMVEVNPILDTRNQTGRLATALLESVLGKVIF